MATPTPPPRTPDPLQGLREGIDAHRSQQDAAKAAGEQLRQQPPPQPPPPPEGEQ